MPNENTVSEFSHWKIYLFAASAAQFLCIVGFTASLTFLPFYVRELGVTEVHQVEMWAGTLVSAGSVSMALVSPLWGVIADRHGRKLMVERAAFGGALVSIGMSFASSVQQLLIFRVLHGILTGTIPAFVALVASLVPAPEVGFSLGLVQTAVYTGFFVGPLLGGIIADYLGYRWAFRVTSILLCLAGIVVYVFIKERFQPVERKSTGSHITGSVRTVVNSIPVMGAIIALGGFYMGTYTCRPILPLFVEYLQRDSHLLNTATGSVYGATAVASALSAALVGRLSDRIGYRNILLACGLGAVLAYVGQALSSSLGFLVFASFAAGLFAGGVMPITNAVLARLIPKEEQGAIYGISNSFNAGGRAVGPMLGATSASAWGLRATFAVTAVLFAMVTGWVALVVKSQPDNPKAEPIAGQSYSKPIRG